MNNVAFIRPIKKKLPAFFILYVIWLAAVMYVWLTASDDWGKVLGPVFTGGLVLVHLFYFLISLYLYRKNFSRLWYFLPFVLIFGDMLAFLYLSYDLADWAIPPTAILIILIQNLW